MSFSHPSTPSPHLLQSFCCPVHVCTYL
ncbi:hypothetical protein CGRA01v4_00243 [Colletotrichum graminicola]|nr:hypothetical protein CGRA01v4_00243 [Colletotrichum graminicola]